VLIAPHLPPPRPGGRPRKTSLRAVVDAIFYLLRTGCQWRLLPKDFPPWGTVWWYFRRWRLDGVWTRLHRALYRAARRYAGRLPDPSVAIMDSQSVKTTERGAFAVATATSGSRDASVRCSLIRKDFLSHAASNRLAFPIAAPLAI
jgi:putative transposase